VNAVNVYTDRFPVFELEILSNGSGDIRRTHFDEVDEGTALYELAATRPDLPSDPPLVSLDADGGSLPWL
jgi:hypothetical protein